MPEMYLVGNVLFDADELVIEAVKRQLPHAGVRGPDGRSLINATLGVVASGKLVGGVLFFNWRGHDIEVAAAFEGMTWARPATLRTLFAYPFVQLSCVRATALTARSNRRARRFLERIGCRLEGVKRRGYDGREDAIAYGLMRDDCKWLKE